MCCCEYCFKTVSLIEEKYRDILYCMWFLTTSIDYCVFYFFLDWYTLIIVNQIDICAFHWICIEIIQTIINTLNFKADYDQHVLVLAQLKALVLQWLEYNFVILQFYQKLEKQSCEASYGSSNKIIKYPQKFQFFILDGFWDYSLLIPM